MRLKCWKKKEEGTREEIDLLKKARDSDASLAMQGHHTVSVSLPETTSD